MTRLLLSVLITACLSGCGRGAYPKRVFVYNQQLLSGNGKNGFEEYIAINDYHNKTMTAMDFYKIARKEARGGRGNKSVRVVNFLGKNENDYKPEYDSTQKEKDQKDFVISFRFAPEAGVSRQAPYLHQVVRWNNGDSVSYTGTTATDSVLQSTEKISNR